MPGIMVIHWLPEAAENVRDIYDIPQEVLVYGTDRLRAALDGMHPATKRYRAWCQDKPISRITHGNRYIEPAGTMSFLAAAMIIRKVGDIRLAGKFAYNEVTYTSYMLHDDDAGLNRVFSAMFGVTPDKADGLYTIPISRYLHLAAGLGASWGLINQICHTGLIYLNKSSYIRLIRDSAVLYLKNRIMKMQTLPSICIPDDIQEWCAAHVAQDYTTGDEPPCVTECCMIMNRGENLTHAGRLLVATYMIHAGADDDTISTLFVGAPDYNKTITSNQLRQIRSRGYDVPGCRWIQRNNICPGCNASHPTRYKKST